MVILSIDGACRRNGKPDCLSAGSVFAKGDTLSKQLCFEYFSTNQRGELSALVVALYHANQLCDEDTYLVTDSEYIYNTLSKDWLTNWEMKGWLTASGDPVKNQDLWSRIAKQLHTAKDNDINIIPYHIKGHLISVGKVTAANIIEADPTCTVLYNTVSEKYNTAFAKNTDKFRHAWELFERNHGFKPPVDTFRELVICNTVSDLLAGYNADKMDAAWIR